jgi:hypothetical protein
MGWLDAVGPVVQKLLAFIPDPQQKAAAQLALFQAQQAGEFKEIDAALAAGAQQNAVNVAEAASGSAFKGGWRPFVGWVCGVGLAYQFLAHPLLVWASTAFWHVAVPPELDTGTLLDLLGGLLGLGAMRTVERINGVIPRGQ